MAKPFGSKLVYGCANALLLGLVTISVVFEGVGIQGFMPATFFDLHDLHGSYVSLHPVVAYALDCLYVLLFTVHLIDFSRSAGEEPGGRGPLDRHDRKLADTHLAVALAFGVGRIAAAREEHYTALAFAFFQVIAVHSIMAYFEANRAVGFGHQVFKDGSTNKVFMWNWVYILAPTSLHHFSTSLTTTLTKAHTVDLRFDQDWAVAVLVIFAAMTVTNEHPIYRVSQLFITFSWVMNRTGQMRLLVAGCLVALYIVLSLAKLIVSGDWRAAVRGDSYKDKEGLPIARGDGDDF